MTWGTHEHRHHHSAASTARRHCREPRLGHPAHVPAMAPSRTWAVAWRRSGPRALVPLLLLLGMWVPVAGGAAGAGSRPDAAPRPPEAGQSLPVTLFVEAAEFASSCRHLGLTLLRPVRLGPATLVQAAEVSSRLLSSRNSSGVWRPTRLGSSLTFHAAATGLPLDFQLARATPTSAAARSRQDSPRRRQQDGGPARHDDGHHSNPFVFAPRRGGLLRRRGRRQGDATVGLDGGGGSEGPSDSEPALYFEGPPPAAGQPGCRAALQARFSARRNHDDAEYRLVFAAGVTLEPAAMRTSVRVRVYNSFLQLVQTLAAEAGPGEAFLGVISTMPLGQIVVEMEGEPEGTTLTAIRQLQFGVGQAHLLDSMPWGARALFWVGFNLFIVVMLVLDFVFFMGRARKVNLWSALAWSAVWILVALGFAAGIYQRRGRGPATLWLTAYLLEKFLSIDNLFVFLSIFASFQTPPRHQHKVLTWGIAGAVFLRAVFIFGGAVLVMRFTWLLGFFGFLLLYTGGKTLHEELYEREDDAGSVFPDSPTGGASAEEALSAHLDESWALRAFGRVFPISTVYDKHGRFFVHRSEVAHHGRSKKAVSPHADAAAGTVGSASPPRSLAGKVLVGLGAVAAAPVRCVIRVTGLDGYLATPLLCVLLIIESTDVVFAADSIPAVLSLTTDPFVAYTSNIFAVLGLRALYFALAAAMSTFSYLGLGLGVILLFIGLKLLALFLGYHVGIQTTLIVVLGTLSLSILLSVLRPRAMPHQPHRRKSSAHDAVASLLPITA